MAKAKAQSQFIPVIPVTNMLFGHIPDIDDDIPLPESALEALPPLSPTEEVEMRTRTSLLIQALNQGHKDVKAVTPPKSTGNPVASTITLAYLTQMTTEYGADTVAEPNILKNYVINRLIQETDNADPKIRLTALKALGEVDGVDAFKKRTESTVKVQPIEEIEAELKETLMKLKNRVNLTKDQPILDVQVKKIKKIEHEEAEKVREDKDLDPENPDADENAADAR